MTYPDPTTTAEQKPLLKDAYFAYRQTSEGQFLVAFSESTGSFAKQYARGFEGRKELAARCEAAAEKNPSDTYAVVDLETYEIADLYGALLREQVEAFSSFEKTYWIQEASDDATTRHPSETKPKPEMWCAVAPRHYRSLLDVAKRIYESTVLDYRFPDYSPFPQALRREIERLNEGQIERGSLDRYVLIEYPKNTGRVAEGPEQAWVVDLF